MKLELRKVKIGIGSRETLNYSADLYVDDTKCATVFNEGSGGMTFINAYPSNQKELLKKAIEYAQTLPAVKSDFQDDTDLPMTLDFWCDLEAGKIEDQKRINRYMKKSILVGVKDASEFGQYKVPHPIADMMKSDIGKESLRRIVASIKSKMKPGEEILNTNIDEILKSVPVTSEK